MSTIASLFQSRSCGLSEDLSCMCGRKDVVVAGLDKLFVRILAWILVLGCPLILFVLKPEGFDTGGFWWWVGIALFCLGLIFLVYVWYTRRKIRVSLKELALLICVEEDTLLKMDRDRISNFVKIYVLEAIVLMRVASRTSKFEDPEYVLLRNEARNLENNTPWGALNFWEVEIGEEIPQTEEMVNYVVSNIKRLGFWQTYLDVQAYAKNIFIPYIKDDKNKEDEKNEF